MKLASFATLGIAGVVAFFGCATDGSGGAIGHSSDQSVPSTDSQQVPPSDQQQNPPTDPQTVPPGGGGGGLCGRLCTKFAQACGFSPSECVTACEEELPSGVDLCEDELFALIECALENSDGEIDCTDVPTGPPIQDDTFTGGEGTQAGIEAACYEELLAVGQCVGEDPNPNPNPDPPERCSQEDQCAGCETACEACECALDPDTCVEQGLCG